MIDQVIWSSNVTWSMNYPLVMTAANLIFDLTNSGLKTYFLFPVL